MLSPKTEALDREDKHISGEEESEPGIHSVSANTRSVVNF